MFIAATLWIAIATGRPADDRAAFGRFFEQLVASETTLKMDRSEISLTKANPASRKLLSDDLTATEALVRSYQASADPSASVKESLDKYLVALSELRMLADSGKKPTAEASKAACCSHDAAYIGVLKAATRVPGFSLEALSPPVRYNLSPVLYGEGHGLVYADPAFPDAARVISRNPSRKSKLRQGDLIVGIRGEDDEDEWHSVKTWKDVLQASEEFDHAQQKVVVRILRKGSLQTVNVISSSVAVNTE